MLIATAWGSVRTQEGCGGNVSDDPTIVTMRERVRVMKIDKDNPDNPPEILEQETITPISLTDAALLGFTPGQGFASDADNLAPPVEGARVGDQ